eukprot:3280475-Rhodomonas_salina.1
MQLHHPDGDCCYIVLTYTVCYIILIHTMSLHCTGIGCATTVYCHRLPCGTDVCYAATRGQGRVRRGGGPSRGMRARCSLSRYKVCLRDARYQYRSSDVLLRDARYQYRSSNVLLRDARYQDRSSLCQDRFPYYASYAMSVTAIG